MLQIVQLLHVHSLPHLPLIIQLPWIHPLSKMLHLSNLYIFLMCRFFALSHFPIFIHCLTPLVSSNVQFLRIFQLCRVHPLSKVPLGFIQCKISKDSSIVQLLNIHPLSNTFTSIHYPTPLVYPSSHFLNLSIHFPTPLSTFYYPTLFKFIHYPSSLDSFVAKKSKDVIMYFTSTSI